MKKTIAVAALTSIMVAGAAYAGSLSDPVVTPEVVMVDAVETSTNVDTLIAVVAVIAIIVGAAGGL